MKKIASRVLALVIALSLLLVPTAFAAERNAATLTIGNFELVMGEDTISLPVYVSLGGGVDIEGARGYLLADLSTQSASALSALAAFENGEIKAYLTGMDYGIAIPLEQIIALIEAELGMTIEEAIAQAMASMSDGSSNSISGMMGSAAGLMESAAALEGLEIAPEALMAALNITLTDKGQTTASLFDVEAIATETAFEMPLTTLQAMSDALASLDPALDAYLDEYFAYINETIAASGEEMTIEDVFSLLSVGVAGSVYEAEAGTLVFLTVSLSAEGETIELPAEFVTLTDEKGSYSLFALVMDVDGESLYLEIYSDDYADAGVDYTNFSFLTVVGDTEAEENDVEISFSFSTQDSAEGVAVGADVYANSYGEPASFGFLYMGAPVESTEAADSYSGLLELYVDADGMAASASLETCLKLSSVPAGELISFTNSINPLEADEETMTKFMSDAQNALIQTLGVLMQDPTLASMIGSMM